MSEDVASKAKQFILVTLDLLKEHEQNRNESLFKDNMVFNQIHQAMTGWIVNVEAINEARLTRENLNVLRCLIDCVYQKAYEQGKEHADREAALNHIYQVKENENA